MNYQDYRKSFFVEPQPAQRFEYRGLLGITLFFQNYTEVVTYYSNVLGEPAYVEGKGTRGWRIGQTWLTLLQGRSGNPTNVEIAFVMDTPKEAERLQQAFIAAGGNGEEPSDQLMYVPIRSCPVTDPFGTQIMIYSPL